MRGDTPGVIEFSLLGSGSSGNATLVRGPGGKFLIDNGFSLRQLTRRLEHVGETLDGLLGVVVTHEHRDHVNGLGVLARRTGVPIYMTPATAGRLPDTLGTLPEVIHFESGQSFQLGDFTLSSFRIAHDAVDPVSFVVSRAGCRLGFATDLGSVSHLVRQRLGDCHALVLESNYCPTMLRTSSYPPAIVQRIRGPHGHLSNQEMNKLLAKVLHPDLQLVVAVHVSQENNTPDKARAMAAQVLDGHAAELVVAAQDDPTPFFRVQAPAESTAPLVDIA